MRKYQLLIAASVVFLDAVTKTLIRTYIPYEDDVSIIPGFFRLTHLRNTGAAFSMFADSGEGAAMMLIGFSFAALAVISYLLWKTGAVLDRTTVSLALIGGGALGNLWERCLRGAVTDFLDFYVGNQHWPPFNVADSAITVGAVVLLWGILLGGRSR